MQVWKDNGLPPNIPFFMTEGNIGGGAPPSTVKSGLWLADYVGTMMSEGAGANLLLPLHAVSRQAAAASEIF